MTVREQLGVISSSCRVVIKRADNIIYSNFNAMADIGDDIALADVKKLTFKPEINHKNWQQLGLMQPLKPEDTPAYSFSDLELRLYYVIDI